DAGGFDRLQSLGARPDPAAQFEADGADPHQPVPAASLARCPDQRRRQDRAARARSGEAPGFGRRRPARGARGRDGRDLHGPRARAHAALRSRARARRAHRDGAVRGLKAAIGGVETDDSPAIGPPRPTGLLPGSSAVEQPAVNRLVDGSNPSRGAISHFGILRLVAMAADSLVRAADADWATRIVSPRVSGAARAYPRAPDSAAGTPLHRGTWWRERTIRQILDRPEILVQPELARPKHLEALGGAQLGGGGIAENLHPLPIGEHFCGQRLPRFT